MALTPQDLEILLTYANTPGLAPEVQRTLRNLCIKIQSEIVTLENSTIVDITALQDGLAALGLQIDDILTETITVVNTFADLPSASSVGINALALVKTTTGILFINRQRKGVYVSDGTNWQYAAEFSAAQLSYDNTVSGLTSVTVQDAIDELEIMVGGGGGGAVSSVNGQTGTVVINKSDVGLPNVDNISDINKPVSTAQQTALNLKADIASPTFTGTVSGITKAMVGLSNVDNTSDVNKPVSTAQATALSGKADTAHTHVISDITGLETALDNKQDLITVSTTAPTSPIVGQLWVDTN